MAVGEVLLSMSGFEDGQFVTQYAIRTPSGELWHPPGVLTGAFLSGLFGGAGDEVQPTTPPPAVWYSRDEAQRQLDSLREQAAHIGVRDWFGVIEQRICSPFTTTDPGEQFAAELQEWLRKQ